jgi:hypothetical protein
MTGLSTIGVVGVSREPCRRVWSLRVVSSVLRLTVASAVPRIEAVPRRCVASLTSIGYAIRLFRSVRIHRATPSSIKLVPRQILPGLVEIIPLLLCLLFLDTRIVFSWIVALVDRRRGPPGNIVAVPVVPAPWSRVHVFTCPSDRRSPRRAPFGRPRRHFDIAAFPSCAPCTPRLCAG